MRTRLAPSPTGALHLGNARTFLVNWALARQRGWRVLLRIDDLDGPRIKPGAAEEAIDLLRWLGLDWDEGPRFQSAHPQPYRDALVALIEAGHAYPCRCTRSQILAASLSAPHAGDHELRYPGTCRPPAGQQADAAQLDDPSLAWRLRTPDTTITFADQFLGSQAFNPQREVGDFLIATKGGQPSYQLAVVVDDACQGVTQVVRGADLLASTARQMILYQRLGLGTPPTYTHLPIVVGEDGRRLAKRHGDTRIDHYRKQGIRPERVLGLLAAWCGFGPPQPLSREDFLDRFSFDAVSTDRVTLTPADEAWLVAESI
ncbi:tRNA glutamyl-Q(34) synthetase GluQRS [Botrimarina hoheduenensis]|uniref:Glutamyl-Q tRNA(Asp) synthetase n=1 Tax=Botrimarina hoheduenensis TaxID=2528000 RepID=A0A5C5WAC3_9BACT|nr:tRNA glutamyl-Q(34) synthetase GluQRS [Botrimarina hoheduenensis]TWT47620.1 Glutamate--tRNA ligase [Botrimarina hoheduenensis]